MNDPPMYPPGSHLAPRGRHHRSISGSTSDSPTRQRQTDDLLSNLSPRLAVEALQNPAGALKACMDAATPSEQAFALRAAVASRKIQEWLDELGAWPWPAGGSSAGFEMAASKRRKTSRSEGSPLSPALSTTDEAPFEKIYMGSLSASAVADYERRIDEISQEMEELQVDDIKSQILHNHIMPLSRPGSPMSESNRSVVSLSTYVRMDDFTALITATTIQALPNLSRLTRLMNVWSTRLLVLRKTPAFLDSLADAEAALQSGWKTLNRESESENKSAGGLHKESLTTLSWEEFRIMKLFLDKIVSKTGRELDTMLDALEGGSDNLPEQWIDQMDSLEKHYAEWVAVCERKIQEAEWAALVKERKHAVQTGLHQVSDAKRSSESRPVEQGTPVIKIHSAVEDRNLKSQGDKAVLPETQQPRDRFDGLTDEAIHPEDSGPDVEPWEMIDVDSEPEPDLPPLPPLRRDSDMSTGTVRHSPPSGIDEFSSDFQDHGSPELPRLGKYAVQTAASDGSSPPSSPPQSAYRSSTRALSIGFLDMPTLVEVPDESISPRTPPLDSSVLMGEDSPKEGESPTKMSADDQLQQQISEILESVPAKIRLTSEPQPINLNPPDFVLPTSRPPRADALRRSQSSMSLASSRSGTPSFLLAPAFGRSRSRQQRGGNSDIKLYHLSRPNGEAPIKLFIRCVGEHGERVMVRVGGGWADLGEYLKEYASHHSRRSGGVEGKVEVKDLPGRISAGPVGSSPPSRPASALETRSLHGSPITPLNVRKTRKNLFDEGGGSSAPGTSAARRPNTPLASASKPETPPSDTSTRSRSSSRVSWAPEEDITLGMAGPRGKRVDMTDESKAWVESVKEKVRIASGSKPPPSAAGTGPAAAATGKLLDAVNDGKFGEIGKVGATKRLFRKQVSRENVTRGRKDSET